MAASSSADEMCDNGEMSAIDDKPQMGGTRITQHTTTQQLVTVSANITMLLM